MQNPWTCGRNEDELDIDSRRSMVQALADRVEVGPVVRGRNFYSPERVRATPR